MCKNLGECNGRKIRRAEICAALTILVGVIVVLVWLVHGFEEPGETKRAYSSEQRQSQQEFWDEVDELTSQMNKPKFDFQDAINKAIEENQMEENSMEGEEQLGQNEAQDPFPNQSIYMKYYDMQNQNDDFVVENVLYRDDNNFLEGFYFDSASNYFYESGGLYGKSKVHVLIPDKSTNILSVDKQSQLPKKYFGEGLAPRSESEFALLTYKARTIITVDRETMSLNDQTYTMPDQMKEGWGMTAVESQVNDNGFYNLYMSDGTYHIYEIDGETMKIIRTIPVRDPEQGGKTISRINELEWVDGFIYANIWYKDIIIKIDPATGNVVKSWVIKSLMRAENAFQKAEKSRDSKGGDCLNGIAYDKNTGSFYLTGKLFYLVFKVKLN